MNDAWRCGIAAMTRRAPYADVGRPGLATFLAWVGLVVVVVGMAITYAGRGYGAERRGFVVTGIGVAICCSSLIVAP